ncbi:alpha/beta fold hydrolase [Acrocarpospora macrocephala]|uniref:Alpha/beta hydrolase n=1 Tax=Acrocarpospora macrocephala TaxID=150177 RepID=A0A5M3WWY5_9ACTN|nr:alpha/beta hydrolase [Acrocarpospora macrocephala]GES12916.1 alpha/beta hydrolase [Acrocarpospora macrocephala]
MNWAERHLVADGCATHYLEAGEGPPLVLLHGGEYGAAAEITWEHCIPALAAHHRVMALDFVGYGHSDKLRDFGGQRRLMLRQVSGVLRALRIESAYFIGTSLSGRMLLDVASKPAPVWPIKAMAVAGIGLAAPAEAARKVLEDFDGTLEGLRPSMDVLFHDPRWRDSESYLRRRYDFCAIPGAWETAAAGNLRSPMRRGESRPHIRPPVRDYGGVAVPTCLIRGEHDRLVPEGTWRELAAQIPGAVAVTVAGSGHYPQIERAAAFTETVLDFFKREGS